jgi:hypothetical protein
MPTVQVDAPDKISGDSKFAVLPQTIIDWRLSKGLTHWYAPRGPEPGRPKRSANRGRERYCNTISRPCHASAYADITGIGDHALTGHRKMT